MHNEVARDLHEMGTLVHPQTMQDKEVGSDPMYRTLELSPYGFTIIDASDRDTWIETIKYDLDWCRADFVERTSSAQINPGRAWKLRGDTWKEFMHPDEDGNLKFAYTYAERFNRPLFDEHGEYIQFGVENVHNPLSRVVEELALRPDTRQAVVPIFDAMADLPNLGGKKRVPCSLHYQFLIREGKLTMLYVMRSSDFLTHFPYDIWMATQMQSHIAGLLDIPPGRFTFFTGSLHLYAKDADESMF